MLLNQYRLYHTEEQPLAFVVWAMLDEAVEARLKSGIRRLQPADWNSGDRPWIIEVIAPFPQTGGLAAIVEDLTKTVFGGVRPKVVGEG